MSETIKWPDGEPFGPRLHYPYSFYDAAPYRDRIIAREQAYQATVERLIAPDVQLSEADVPTLVEAYYRGYYYPYQVAEATVPYPPIPRGKWFAPIRVTYQGLDDDLPPHTKILDVPTVATAEEAIEVARHQGLWESFRAPSRYENVIAVDVLLSGQLSFGDEAPRWNEVWLIPPEQLPVYDAGIASLKEGLSDQGYTFS